MVSEAVDLFRLAQDSSNGRSYEHSNGPSGSIKGRTFLDQQRYLLVLV